MLGGRVYDFAKLKRVQNKDSITLTVFETNYLNHTFTVMRTCENCLFPLFCPSAGLQAECNKTRREEEGVRLREGLIRFTSLSVLASFGY